MIRIDFGTLYEFEQEDTQLKQENRQKIADIGKKSSKNRCFGGLGKKLGQKLFK